MRIHPPLPSATCAAGLLVFLLALGTAGCGERAGGAEAGRTDGGPPPPAVDPCGLLTDEEVSEQLWLTVNPSQRENYNARGFDVTRTEVPWGISRRCELEFRSRATVSGLPTLRGDFNVMVSRASAVGVPENEKKPIAGMGDEAFQHQEVWYVRVGDLVASLTDFDGTNEPGLEEDAGRLALLKLMAERLR